jgi:hypothetical protein
MSSWCVDPNCPCERCLGRCDDEAAAGRIPLNAAWWMQQRAFPVGYPAGETAPRVQGFFAEEA